MFPAPIHPAHCHQINLQKALLFLYHLAAQRPSMAPHSLPNKGLFIFIFGIDFFGLLRVFLGKRRIQRKGKINIYIFKLFFSKK